MTATDRVARLVFATLVLACLAAFFITQRLKHTPTAVQMFKLTPRFSPTPRGRLKSEGISFRLAHSDQVTVTITDADGGEVATILRDRRVQRYKQLSLRWNGRRGPWRGVTVRAAADGHVFLEANNAGPLAAAGEYHVRVSLRDQRRSVESPRGFMLLRG